MYDKVEVHYKLFRAISEIELDLGTSMSETETTFVSSLHSHCSFNLHIVLHEYVVQQTTYADGGCNHRFESVAPTVLKVAARETVKQCSCSHKMRMNV